MRVLHFIPDIGISNGIMSVILNYYNNMPEDIDFDIIYFKDTERTRKSDIEKLGGRVYKIERPSLRAFFTRDIDKFFKNHKDEYSFLHIHHPAMTVFLAPTAKKYGVKNIAIHCHSTWFSFKKRNIIINRILSIIAKNMTTYMFACGRDAGIFWYSEKDFKNGKVTVINNAVDCEKFRFSQNIRDEYREKLDVSDKFVVGHVGRVKPPQKNHPFIIKIFSEIKKINSNAVLMLAGADEDYELSNIAKSLNVYDDIKFMGQRKDVDKLLQVFDVFLFPSFYEGLPVAAVEAQAAGLPVIMSDCITDEVCITDNAIRLSLDESPKLWAKKAIELSNKFRIDTFDIMKCKGWNIKDSAQNLAHIYKEV